MAPRGTGRIRVKVCDAEIGYAAQSTEDLIIPFTIEVKLGYFPWLITFEPLHRNIPYLTGVSLGSDSESVLNLETGDGVIQILERSELANGD